MPKEIGVNKRINVINNVSLIISPCYCIYLLLSLHFGYGLQDAIEQPRLMTHSHPDSFAPHHASPNRLTIEGRVPEAVTDGLSARGHQVERLADWTHAVAGMCAVRKDLSTGQIEGGADPRRWSRSMGW